MTQHQPVAAQSRIMALNRGEPDPMASCSGSSDTPYSAELLQAIQWMLRPEYNDRPQSAGEILALLKSGQASDQTGSLTSRQAATEVADSSPAAKNILWTGVMAGIVALVTVGLWFDEKPAEKPDNRQGAASQPLFQRNPGKTTVMPETKEEQSVALTSTPSSQASGSENRVESEKQSNKQGAPEKPTGQGLIQEYLAAAEKAMKATHLTTPVEDNAYSYYQMILAMEPGNTEARAGLQKIVDRYVQFIEKARIEGRLNNARLYLQRAESVLPGDPKLQRIRTELIAAR
ncbi:MAG: serine/threonine protein kinase, partial [Pseudomonadota bacterium]